MADEQSPHDSELTPEQETMVRRLLAEARHDEALPDAVAARLDRALVRLRDEQPAASAPVVDLATRRRRRNAGRLLFAAAAIVVGGVAAGQLLGSGSSGDSADSSSADAPSAREFSAAGGESEPASGTDNSGGGKEDAAGAPQALDPSSGLPVHLSSQSFGDEVRRLAKERHQALSELASAAEDQRDLLVGVPGFDCPAGAYGDGTLVPAYYDAQPAVLAFRPPLGSNQVAELLECGTAQKLRSVTLTDQH